MFVDSNLKNVLCFQNFWFFKTFEDLSSCLLKMFIFSAIPDMDITPFGFENASNADLSNIEGGFGALLASSDTNVSFYNFNPILHGLFHQRFFNGVGGPYLTPKPEVRIMEILNVACEFRVEDVISYLVAHYCSQ